MRNRVFGLLISVMVGAFAVAYEVHNKPTRWAMTAVVVICALGGILWFHETKVSGRTIRARLPDVDVADLTMLRGVSEADRRGDTIFLTCMDALASDTALRELLARYPQVLDIEVRGVGLSEVSMDRTSVSNKVGDDDEINRDEANRDFDWPVVQVPFYLAAIGLIVATSVVSFQGTSPISTTAVSLQGGGLPSAVTSCEVDGSTLLNAMSLFSAKNPGVMATPQLLLSKSVGAPFISAWPSNTSHYVYGIATSRSTMITSPTTDSFNVTGETLVKGDLYVQTQIPWGRWMQFSGSTSCVGTL